MVSKAILGLCTEQGLSHNAITRILNKVKGKDLTTLSLGFFQDRLNLIQSYAEKLEKTHAKLLAEVSEEVREGITYFSSDLYSDILDSIEEASDFLLDNINRIYNENDVALRNSSTSTSSSTQANSSLNLPKFQFPKFTGNYEDWPNFNDLFTTTIHNNQSLSKLQKLQYLKSCLNGEAYEVIKSYAITEDNYSSAWAALSERYENKRIIKTALLNKLFALPNVNNSNLSNLRKLFDTYKQVTESMKNLCSPITNDPLVLVHLLLQRFDHSLKREWEVHISDESDYPTLAHVDRFLLNKIRTLEAMSVTSQGSTPRDQTSKHSKLNSFNTTKREGVEACPACHCNHRLITCNQFQKMSTADRYQLVSRAKLCHNCLAAGHYANNCRSKFRCRTCSKLHHSMLHSDKPQSNSVKATTASETSNPQVNALHNFSEFQGVLLTTALILTIAPNGRRLPVRALLDPGSETSFITEKVAQHLRLPRYKANASVAGIGGTLTASMKHSTTFTVNSLKGKETATKVSAFILPQLTAYCPKTFDASRHPELRGIQLADPHPPMNGKVDVVLGADVYGEIIQGGIIRLSKSKVFAQKTKFGWVLSGPTTPNVHHGRIVTSQLTNLDVSQQLEKFWEAEDVPTIKFTKEEDEFCEQHFLKTYKRDETGRFVVRLPFKENFNLEELGESKHRALGSYNRLQRQFSKEGNVYKQYSQFMEEYEELGHMTKVSERENQKRVYLPHHAVIKEQSLSTKLRVVFNASCNTSTGKNLNEAMCIGPKLQNDIVSIVTNWRFHQYVIIADIEKMFRQILVHPEDRRFQCIVWGKRDSVRPDTFELNTVTYGTTAAPYLAMRAIKQLIIEDGHEFPVAAELLRTQIYVDDILMGTDNKTSLLNLKHQVISLLEKGGFILKKWSSNIPELVTEHATGEVNIQCPESPEQKVLGISWKPVDDKFTVKTSVVNHDHISKRFMLSTIGKLYDPLGWLSPIIIRAKVLMQELWVTGLNWDDPVPDHIRKKWMSLCGELPELEEISIPRWINCIPSTSKLQLIGFSDASRQAYSAVVYLRSINPQREVHTSLLIAKSKVAPLKTLSIPRLELCGAVLLSKLIDYIKNNLSYPIEKTMCFTDSKIVLSWLARTPSTWTTYVANRVSFIQTTLPHTEWLHVKSADNSADLNSRGLSAEKLITSSLWWNGPNWLNAEFTCKREIPEDTTEEIRASTTLLTHPTKQVHLFENYSTWTKTLNVAAYVFKYIRKSINPKREKSSHGSLEREDIQNARQFLFKTVQTTLFPEECNALSSGKPVSLQSRLSKLNPFLDQHGLIRVGGRLEWAEGLTYEQKHPIILGNHHLVKLLIRHHHLTSLHAGLQLTLQVVRNKFWILNARNITKSVIHDCVTCTRHAARLETEQMSSLPQSRCTPSRTFSHVGVDYAGPFAIRTTAGRGHHCIKMYIAVFVCFATRAIHLEIVSNYATSGFLAALQRFIARRGIPDTIYSDNGTNFQGANSELKRAFKSAIRDPNLRHQFTEDNIEWKFIPPSAPHFGGLWEAGVKSVKHHLKRVVGKFTPTMEEFSTLLCRIEACLNSRPLSKLRDDPDDLHVLTPGHFLTGAPLKAIPEPSCLDLNENRLSRWQAVTRMVEHFWRIWSSDYLQSLQHRNKWTHEGSKINLQDIVIIRDPNQPPARWALGRVIELIESKDKLTRVVKLKTADTELVRPITQLCKLPVSA